VLSLVRLCVEFHWRSVGFHERGRINFDGGSQRVISMYVTLLRVIVVAFCVSCSLAAVEVLDGASSFPPDSVRIDYHFDWNADLIGAHPNLIGTDWGVSLSGTQPQLQLYPGPYASLHWDVINPKMSGVSRPLVIDFASEAKRAGVLLVNGETVRVSVFARSGHELASANRVFAPIPISGIIRESYLFVGFKSEDEPIAKMVVEYGGTASSSDDFAEMLHWIVFEPQLERNFTHYVPHFVSGRLDPDLVFRSELVLLNVSNSTAQVDVRFFNPSGQALEVEVAPKDLVGIRRSQLQFELDRDEQLVLSGDNLVSGYCKVTSDVPIGLSLRMRRFDSAGSLVSEIETPAMPAVRQASGSLVYQRFVEAVDVETALAFVNTSTETAKVHISGVEAVIELAPGQQLARFLGELNPDSFPKQDEGDEPTLIDVVRSFTVTSNKPIALSAFRTVGGLPVTASLVYYRQPVE